MGRRDGSDPALRIAALLLPRGLGLRFGYRAQRKAMGAFGCLGQIRSTPVVAVDSTTSVRIHRAPTPRGTHPALLWIHGGGTLMGSARQEDRFCRRLAEATDVSVVSVDHRLAPENPYPAPLDDCHAAYRWLIRQPWIDPSRVAIGGASAGGGLAAALAQRLATTGEQQPALQMLVYPMLDDRTGSRGIDVRGLRMWSGEDNAIAWRHYLGNTAPDGVAPARLAELSGLAPAWLGVGSSDLFHDETVSYAQRLRDGGVEVRIHLAEGAFHAFDLIAPRAAASRAFFAEQRRALRSALSGTGDPMGDRRDGSDPRESESKE